MYSSHTSKKRCAWLVDMQQWNKDIFKNVQAGTSVLHSSYHAKYLQEIWMTGSSSSSLTPPIPFLNPLVSLSSAFYLHVHNKLMYYQLTYYCWHCIAPTVLVPIWNNQMSNMAPMIAKRMWWEVILCGAKRYKEET